MKFNFELLVLINILNTALSAITDKKVFVEKNLNIRFCLSQKKDIKFLLFIMSGSKVKS